MMTPLVTDIVAVIGAVTALVVALPALVIALKGQGDHRENVANITAAKETADSALQQSAQALLHAPSPAQNQSSSGTTVNTGPGGTANVTEAADIGDNHD